VSLAALREREPSPIPVYQEVARQVGIDPAGIATLEELLFRFCEMP